MVICISIAFKGIAYTVIVYAIITYRDAINSVSVGNNRVNDNCVGNTLKSNTYTNNHTFNLANTKERGDKGQESELNPVIKLQWLDNDFAIDVKNNLIVCPYFDYRQLTNEKIQRLAGLLTQLYLSK